MSIRFRPYAFFLLILSPACHPGDPDRMPVRIASALNEDLEEDLLAQSCSGTVLVAEGKACVGHPQWRARPLFPEENRGAGRLDRYCVFEWEGEGLPRPDQYPHADDPDPPRPDCAAVSPMADALAPLLTHAQLEARFLDHVRALPVLPAATDPAAVPVAVSVIDTARGIGAPGEPGAGNAPHGRAMGLVIDRLACPPGGACAARIDNVPALRMIRTPAGLRRDSDGGYWGYLNDIAWGIGLAVARRPPGRHQILNLSLGWNPELGDVQANRPHVRAVYDALRFARCHGALPIAAAGNTRGQRPPPEGPLVPAAWQRFPAPTAEECQQDFGITPAPAPAGPLVFAVSAVDPFDRFLTTTPPGGVAELAAPGLQVIVTDGAPPPGPPPVGPQTGSSPAAATASALAAIVWSYFPELPPEQVMEKVAAAGVELDASADFCSVPGACPRVRRLSACALVQAACQAGRCSPIPTCDPDLPRGAPLPGPPAAPLPRDCTETRAPRGCAEDPPEAIANRRMLPLGDPQPNEDPCGSTCGLGIIEGLQAAARPTAPAPTGSLRLELPINPNLARYEFSAHRIWIRDDDTPARGWLQIDLRTRLPPDQKGGTTLRLDLDRAEEGIVGQIHAAQIDFTFDDNLLDGRPIRRLVGTPITVPAAVASPPAGGL